MDGKPSKTSLPDRPLVSIVTVCLNSEKYLEQTIQSVINQTYDNIEYIIVDGGSTDKTLDIIKKYEEYIVCWISEPDKGLYDAMNKGIALARGKWVGIINSDDWYAPDTVHCVVKAAAEKPETGVFFGNMMMVRQLKNGRGVRQSLWKIRVDDFPWKTNIPHSTCFVARRIYEQFHFNPVFRICGDVDLLVRLYYSGIKFSQIDHTLASYRFGGVSDQGFYRQIIEHYMINNRYHRLKALYVWFYGTIKFLFPNPYKYFPETFKEKCRTCKKKLRACRGHQP